MSWIEDNLERMMGQVAEDARYQRPLPLSITMSTEAYQKFVEILKSKSAFFPKYNGMLDFLTVPVRLNPRLPMGTFTVERFKDVAKV